MNKFLAVKTRVKSLSRRRICRTERAEMSSLRGKVNIMDRQEVWRLAEAQTSIPLALTVDSERLLHREVQRFIERVQYFV
ncbi:hypothetical protein L798_10582 [Zootermopsis nevadensis]|uniref:Uncharacterized protein n=1 Tax=Zootermopsis nevadensis TaxID=136037 RepID=A0A067QYU7_ZOONE|nr:hypothetical protein L798_10582 [Zootermopsis nevadensis]